MGDTGADKRVVMRFLKYVCLQDIQPLRYFNFGGDETPEGAWEGSPACDQYTADNGEPCRPVKLSVLVASLVPFHVQCLCISVAV